MRDWLHFQVIAGRIRSQAPTMRRHIHSVLEVYSAAERQPGRYEVAAQAFEHCWFDVERALQRVQRRG